MITIFKIGEYDFSDYVNRRTYDVSQEDETVSWKDANSVIHTTVVRTRVKGKVELVFTREVEHSDFLDVVRRKCVDGYWFLSLYVNNTHEFKTIKVRIDITAKTVFGNNIVNGRPVVNKTILEIEEV